MSQYRYSSLLPGERSIRLLKLVADVDEAEIRCQLIDYQLPKSRQSGLYESLSYVWGDLDQTQRIAIAAPSRKSRFRFSSDYGDTYLEVTTNLYSALRRLRDPDLDRIIWVDAVCINQHDLEERASRVLVWLGEEAGASDMAFQMIRSAVSAEEPRPKCNPLCRGCMHCTASYNPQQSDAIRLLLRRPWFTRVWVLQEVAAARSTMVFCGGEEMTGSVFCEGLHQLRPLYQEDHDLLPLVQSTTYLIHWDRTTYTAAQPGFWGNTSSLGIQPLHELVNMFNSYQASDPRDKVYALLGMSSDDASNADLMPDYRKPWSDLLQQLTHAMLGHTVSVTMPNGYGMAVIDAAGCPLGRVAYVAIERSRVGRLRKQRLVVKAEHFCKSNGDIVGWKAMWDIPGSAKLIQENDILCLLHGSQRVSIIRPCNGFFLVIVLATNPPPYIEMDANSLGDVHSVPWAEFAETSTSFRRKFQLLWDWGNGKDLVYPSHTLGARPPPSKPRLDAPVPEITLDKVSNFARIMEDLKDPDAIGAALENAESLSIIDQASLAFSHIAVLKKCHKFWEAYSSLKWVILARLPFLPGTITLTSPDGSVCHRDERVGSAWDVIEITSFGEANPQVMTAACNRALKYCVKNDDSDSMEALFQIFSTSVTVDEDLLRLIATKKTGDVMLRHLQRYVQENLPISRVVVEAAVKNEIRFDELMGLLTDWCGHDLPISPDIVASLAQKSDGVCEVLTNLLESGHNGNIELAFKVLQMAAVAVESSPEIQESVWRTFLHPNARCISYLIEETELCDIVATKTGLGVFWLLYGTYDTNIERWWPKSNKQARINDWCGSEPDQRKQVLLQEVVRWAVTD